MSNIPPRWGFSLLWWTSIVPSNCWQSSACRTRVLSTAESLKESEWNELRHGGVRRNGGKSQDVIFGVSDMLIAPLQPDAEQSCHPAGSRGSALHSQLKGSTDTSKHRQRLQQQHNTVWRFTVPQDDTSQQLASNDCYQLADWDVASDSQFSSISAPFKGKNARKTFIFFLSRHSSVFSRYNPCSLLLKDCLVVQWVEYWVQLTVYTTRLVYEVIFHCGSLNTVHHKALSMDCEKKLGRLVSRSKLHWSDLKDTTLCHDCLITIGPILVNIQSWTLEKKKTAIIRLIQNLSQNAEFNCV